MNKTEFLNALKNKLEEELRDPQVSDHVHYYEQYITLEVQKGMTEEDVISALGDPVLLARTILETSNDSTCEKPQDNVYTTEQNRSEGTYRGINFSAGWGCLLAVIAVIIMLIVFLWLVGAIVGAVLPIIMPVVLVLFVLTLIKKRK